MTRAFPLRQKIFPRFSQHDQLHGAAEHLDTEPTVKCHDKLKTLINHQLYSLWMAILTIYSIFAIDVQKAFFDQPAAYIFGYVHIIAIIIFAIDMVLSWIGRDDYQCSFYFWIDVISTASMSMEITWVDNYLTDNSNLPGVLTIAKVVKASRLSRIGGRAAKMILIFMAYLKTKKEMEEKREKIRNNQVRNTDSMVGESNNKTITMIEGKTKQDIQYVAQDEVKSMEMVSEVPKKIELNRNELHPIAEERMSERSQSINSGISHSQSKESMAYIPAPSFLLGKRRSKLSHSSSNIRLKKRQERVKTFDVTNILQRMEQTFKLEPITRLMVDRTRSEEVQKKWRELCDREEQVRKKSKQKIRSNKQNFKLGEILKQRIQKNIIIMIMSLIIILPLISAQTWFNKDPTVDQLMGNYFQLINSLNDSSTVEQLLQDIVIAAQDSTYPILYMEASTKVGNMTYPGNIMSEVDNSPPVSDFMQAEIIQETGTNYQLVFNGRGISQTTAVVNIARSCFITILLIFSTIIFMYSIQQNALTPLEKMSVSINKIAINPFDALRDVVQNEKEDNSDPTSELQTELLEETVKKMTRVLALGAGETGSQLISSKVDSITNDSSCNLTGTISKIHGVFLCVKISNFQKMCEVQKEELLPSINQICTYLHDIIMENGGIIIENSPPYFMFFWHTPEDLNIEQQTTKYYVPSNPLKNLGKIVQTQKVILIALRSYLQITIALDEMNKKWMQQFRMDDQFQHFYLQAGVHIGNGHQGPVGNSFKLQVKCIGPDLDFTRSLCELASQYHLSNIVSEQICEIIDDLPQSNLRKIDYVKESKWGDQFWLCTYDFSMCSLSENGGKRQSKKKRKPKKQKTFRQQKQRSLLYKKRAEILQKLKSEPIDVVMPFSLTEKQCLKPFGQKFYTIWNDAIELYFSGDWDEAIPLFQSINERLDLKFKEPVSLFLLERMGSMGGQPGEDWQKTVQIIME